MRAIFIAIMIAAAPFGARAVEAAAPITAEQFVSECKANAMSCRTTILAHTDALKNAAKICIPQNVAREQVAVETADTLDDVLEETGDELLKSDPNALIDQILEFRWSCKERPTS